MHLQHRLLTVDNLVFTFHLHTRSLSWNWLKIRKEGLWSSHWGRDVHSFSLLHLKELSLSGQCLLFDFSTELILNTKAISDGHLSLWKLACVCFCVCNVETPLDLKRLVTLKVNFAAERVGTSSLPGECEESMLHVRSTSCDHWVQQIQDVFSVSLRNNQEKNKTFFLVVVTSCWFPCC